MYDLAIELGSLVVRVLLLALEALLFLLSNYVLLILVIGDIYLSYHHAQHDFPSWQTPLLSYAITVAIFLSTGEPFNYLFLQFILPLGALCLVAYGLGKIVAKRQKRRQV